jgi:two-component system LytT family sensor kinase
MLPRLQIPMYTSKDLSILAGTSIPLTFLINAILYGEKLGSSAAVFCGSFAVTFFFLALSFVVYGYVALSLRARFPNDDFLFKRLGICIGLFLLMSVVYISLLLRLYDLIHLYDYSFSEKDFIQVYLIFTVVTVFLTFLNEGVYQFGKYHGTIKETERLKTEYMHSQLLGLKSQMNPHFLFNCLNTLSSLIHENGEQAEEFLNHMSKVYRYLLRNNEEQFVTIETEVNFIKSYYYLLRSRHTDSLNLDIFVNHEAATLLIPPLTLQAIVENATNQNTMSKANPLNIVIQSTDTCLKIVNNIHRKLNYEDDAPALENVFNKYKLLSPREAVLYHTESERVICLPYITHPEISYP